MQPMSCPTTPGSPVGLECFAKASHDTTPTPIPGSPTFSIPQDGEETPCHPQGGLGGGKLFPGEQLFTARLLLRQNHDAATAAW